MATEHEWVAGNGDVWTVRDWSRAVMHVSGVEIECHGDSVLFERIFIPADVLPNVAAALQAMSERASDEQ